MSFWGSKQLIGRVSTDSERATARGRPAGGGGGGGQETWSLLWALLTWRSY